jgi:hypothetical protein
MPDSSVVPTARAQAEQILGLHDGVGDGAMAYVVLDAAQDATIYPRLRRAGADTEVVPLYAGAAAADLAAVAPYLVRLLTGDALFDWLWGAGWGRNWGVFLSSTAPIDPLRAHFRRLTRIRVQNGRTLLFRFYDPRVLPAFLPICDPEQLDEVFGPVTQFCVEADGGAALEQFSRVGGQLLRQRHALPARG